MRRASVLAVLAVLAVAPACRPDSCLEGACPVPCAKLSFACAPRPLFAGRVADAPAAYRLALGQAADADVLISNGIVTAVIAAIDAPIDLAPTGGNLIELGPAGGTNDLTLVYQIAGILPDDAFAYRSLEVEEGDGVVRATVRGALDGRPDVRVVTRYELGPCDPGLRARSELFNGSPDAQAFMIADTLHWGKRRVAPFAPLERRGYVQPELSLDELAALWTPMDYSAGASPQPGSPGYGVVPCGGGELAGANDVQVSGLGTPMRVVEPGDTLVHERMLVAAGSGRGPAPAIDALLAARAQRSGMPLATIAGRVVAGGMPFGGDARRASIVVRAGDRPVTAVIPGPDGAFSARVPPGPVTVAVWSFGRPVAEVTASDGAAGDLEVPLPATVQVSITGPAPTPRYGLVAFHPADEATRAAVTGTFHGRFGACAPWLGPPHGGSPACNRALIEPAGTELEVPAGRYRVFATAGPELTLAAAEVELVAGEIASLAFALEPLAVAPPGWLSADLHVHGRASFDSGIPDVDRVRSFAAAGVQVIAATDHDVIGDYTRTVRALGLDDRLAVMGGLETTQMIPWLDVPGEAVPRVIGHFNFWPLTPVPGAPRAGAPFDERMEPGTLFDIMAPLVGPDGMMMLNHPWDEPVLGRDLGYLRAIKFDPRRPIDADHVLLERPGGGRRNLDWNIIEIINGAEAIELQKARVLWASLLAQGYVTPGSGNSDSHGLSDVQVGWARNWVDAGTTVAGFDAQRFNEAVRDGRFVAGTGVVVTAELGPPGGPLRGLGLAPYRAGPGDVLAITVRAAPWIPVDEVRVVTSRGTKVIARGAALMHPPDPFGTAGVLRYQAQVPLAALLGGRDDFLIVEAGLPLPPAADLDDDGVPDTGDNDGDGDADADDLAPGHAAGPFRDPPDPSDPADPRYYLTRVVPEAYPQGFTNPLLVDVDGGGWTPPGLP